MTSTEDIYSAPQTGIETTAFVTSLSALAPIFTAPPGGSEFRRPTAWAQLSRAENEQRMAAWKPGHAIMAVMGEAVSVVDVDTKAGADIEKVRATLDGLGVRIYADVVTPSGGRHFYTAGHADLPTVHASEGRDGFVGLPGTEVLSHGHNVFLPGTCRPKYTGAGYTVIENNLDALADGGDPDSAEKWTAWVSENRVTKAEPFETAAPWTGEAPDARQAAYLKVTMRNVGNRVASTLTGGRNVAVYNGAMALGNYVAGAGMDEEAAEEMLLDAATSCGLVSDDGEQSVRASIRSGLRNGKQNPRAVPDQDLPSNHEDLAEFLVPPVLDHTSARIKFPRLDLVRLLSAERPPREWVIDGLIPAGASVAVVAPAGTGKSLLVLAAMIAVARGDKDFAGLPITARRVVLVDMENTEDDLADRLKALGITPANAASLDQLVPLHLPPLGALDTALGGSELSTVLDAYDVGPGDVVVLDSLQRVINGPENDSDTMRAFYRHTAFMLKRRGLTVIRTDNTGKDPDRGARGTSGKRDDVDVELILTLDAQHAGRMNLKPGKVRLSGITPIVLERHIDENERLSFSTAGDPFRAAVIDAVLLLDQLDVPIDQGLNKTFDRVKEQGYKVTRDVLRIAVKERRTAHSLTSLTLCRTPRHGRDETVGEQGVPGPIRTSPHSSTATGNLPVNTRAEHDGTVTARHESSVTAGGVPLSSLSRERHARTPNPTTDQLDGPPPPVPRSYFAHVPRHCDDCGSEHAPQTRCAAESPDPKQVNDHDERTSA